MLISITRVWDPNNCLANEVHPIRLTLTWKLEEKQAQIFEILPPTDSSGCYMQACSKVFPWIVREIFTILYWVQSDLKVCFRIKLANPYGPCWWKGSWWTPVCIQEYFAKAQPLALYAARSTRSGDIYDVITLSEYTQRHWFMPYTTSTHAHLYNASMCVLFIAHKSRGNNI